MIPDRLDFHGQRIPILRAWICGLVGVGLFLGSCGNADLRLDHTRTRQRLEAVRNTKKAELVRFFEETHAVATAAADDRTLLRYFDLLQGGSGLPDQISPRIFHEIDRHFVDHYHQFYDLLMLDATGFVFHSIRRESDYGTRLIADSSTSLLANQLRSPQGPAFVDFEYYPPSREPASFHVIPVGNEERFRGWLVFQTPVNSLNEILTDRSRLGRTGEVYLVNGAGLMLSDSRFLGEETILKKAVDTEATRRAFKHGQGYNRIADYRNVSVFSAFDRCNILGHEWAIVAEIDEAEVVTDYYLAHRDALEQPILEALRRSEHPGINALAAEQEIVAVDMGEFGRAEPGQLLITSGVATCTAVGVTYAGRFAYLAHLTPTDASYTDKTTRLFLEAQGSDLVGRLMSRVLRFDVLPYELGDLRIVIVATHDETFLKIVDRLVENGLFLSQIKVSLRPDALYANVYTDPTDGAAHARWFGNGEEELGLEQVSEEPDLMAVINAIAGDQPNQSPVLSN